MARNRSSDTARASAAAPSQRQLRVGELIRRTLSDVLQRGDVHDAELSRVPITVGEVRVSADLRIATAFVLPLGGQDAEGVLAALRRNRHELRHLVVRGMTLKFAPELRFEIDDTFDRMDATRRMFAEDHVRQDLLVRETPAPDPAAPDTPEGEPGDDKS